MAEPKLTRIMTMLAARLATISVANGFHTDIGLQVERYPRVFNEGEAPACSIYLGSADIGGNQGSGIKTDPGLIIHASHRVTGIAEDVAIQMLADIHKSIEIPSSTIPQQPDIIRKVNEAGWQIIYPDNLGDIVSVEVLYSFSYSRQYGED